jgi:hypothetical protein
MEEELEINGCYYEAKAWEVLYLSISPRCAQQLHIWYCSLGKEIVPFVSKLELHKCSSFTVFSEHNFTINICHTGLTRHEFTRNLMRF